MSGAWARAEAIGQEAARRKCDEVATLLRERLNGVQVDATGDGVALSARGLRRRFLEDARLRWIGGLLR